MSDTPRTDAAFTSICKRFRVVDGLINHYDEDHVPADFARQLERELNEAMRELRYAKDGESTARKISHAAQIERDLVQEKLLKAENEHHQWQQCAAELASLLKEYSTLPAMNNNTYHTVMSFYQKVNLAYVRFTQLSSKSFQPEIGPVIKDATITEVVGRIKGLAQAYPECVPSDVACFICHHILKDTTEKPKPSNL